VGLERRARYFEKEALREPILRFDDRAFVRKAQYMFGWDWGPRLVSAGICGEVSLIEHSGRLLDVHVLQRHLPAGAVELELRSELDGPGHVLHFLEGRQSPIEDGEVVRLEQPELWWPAGLGAQRLYGVRSFLVPEPCARLEEAERAALDVQERRIGLRQVRLLRQPDSFGESFELEVNGKPFWAVGANWIPDHSFPAAVTAERYREQVARARDLNMNMLRVWGGGLYESEAFYAACDELGVLVWQDFPYACSYYPDDQAAQAEAEREAVSAVKRLRHHASLAIWCGNNENLVMYQDKWVDPAQHPPRYYGEAIYEGVLPQVVARLDPEHPYVASSPAGGENANASGVGDQHYWDVWHGRGDWKFYRDSGARFASEFGFASAPSHAALCAMMSGTLDAHKEPLELDARHRVARWHDKTAKGYETFIGYVELHYPPARNLEEWAYTSQLNQRDALRQAIEHYRRSEFCKGTLIWQLNDCWPVQSWAVLDSLGAYKAAAFELRRLYAPALVSLECDEQRLRVWTILDNAPKSLSAQLSVEARRLGDGKVLQRWELDVVLQPGQRQLSLDEPLPGFEPETTLLVAELAGQKSHRLLCEPKQARLSAPELRATLAGSKLTLTSNVPVVDLFVWDPAGGLCLLDNFITLAHAGELVLRASGVAHTLSARSLAGRHSISVEVDTR
jgi:beta-mannosidase